MKLEHLCLIPFLLFLLVALVVPRFWQIADAPAFDASLRLRHALLGPRPLDPRLTLVVADDKTYRTLGVNDLGLGRLASLVRTLAKAGAQLVLVDILMTEGSPSDLEAMTGALRQIPVVLPRLLSDGGPGFRFPAVVVLASPAEGSLVAFRDPDGIQRRGPAVDPKGLPSLASQAARLLGAHPDQEPVLIDYPGPSGTSIPLLRFESLLDSEQIPLHLKLALQGAVVVVGDAGSRSRDLTSTPFEPSTPASVLPLLELDARISSSLTEGSPVVSMGAAVLLALTLGYWWKRHPSRAGFRLATFLLCLLFALAWASFVWFHLYWWTLPLGMALTLSVTARSIVLAVNQSVEHRILEAHFRNQAPWVELGQRSGAALHSIHGLSVLAVQLGTKREDRSQGAQWNLKAFESIQSQAKTALLAVRPSTDVDSPVHEGHAVVQTALSAFQFRYPGVPLQSFLDDPPLTLTVPASILTLTLTSLLDNAVEARAEAASDLPIRFVAEKTSHEVRFSISDSGKGIPFCRGCAKPRCLPCPRLRLGFTTKPSGNGFGLSQARELARRQGGSFHLNTGPSGTTVILGFPISSDKP